MTGIMSETVQLKGNKETIQKQIVRLDRSGYIVLANSQLVFDKDNNEHTFSVNLIPDPETRGVTSP